MSIDFSKVTAITTPSGALSSIKRTSDSVQLWPTVKSKDFSYMYIGLNADNGRTSGTWSVNTYNETNIVKTNTSIGTYIQDNKLYEKYPYALLLIGGGGHETGAQMTDDTSLPMPKLKSSGKFSYHIELNECVNNEVIGVPMGCYRLSTLSPDYTVLDYDYYYGGVLSFKPAQHTTNYNHFVVSSTINTVGLVMGIPDDTNIDGWSQNVISYQTSMLPYIGYSNLEKYKKLSIPMVVLMVTKDFVDVMKLGSTSEDAVKLSIIMKTISDEMFSLWSTHTKPTSAKWVEIE